MDSYARFERQIDAAIVNETRVLLSISYYTNTVVSDTIIPDYYEDYELRADNLIVNLPKDVEYDEEEDSYLFIQDDMQINLYFI